MKQIQRKFNDFNNKKSFPGSIDISTGEYHYPLLFHKDAKNNIRNWQIKLRLIKGEIKNYGIDWNLMLDNVIPIKKEYLESTNLPECITQVWVETGVVGGKQTRYPPSYPEIKNKGKINERNTLEQGLVDARTLYLKKLENGMEIEKDFKKNNNLSKCGNYKTLYFPMLVKKYDDEKKNLIYPIYIQPKLDGARCIIFLNKPPNQKPTIENVIMYSRQKKEYTGFNEIREELLPSLKKLWDYENNGSIYIDGELYKHGLNLQTISGAIRNPNRDIIDKYKGIKFWIFDIFYPCLNNLEFIERNKIVNKIFNDNDGKNIVNVITKISNDETETDKIYSKFIKENYEGIILRNSNSLYLTNSDKNDSSIRSKVVLKRKMTYSDEFEVIDFTEGKKGKDKGAIIWILKSNKTDKEFNATPKNITYDERYKLFKKAMSNNKLGFKNLFKNRLMTIEYEDLSKDGIPLRAKSVGFREHI